MSAPVRHWEPGSEVEAYHPARHRAREWEPATVVQSATETMPYVTVRWADGGESTTYHLNVRVPGEEDPVRSL